MCLYEALSSGSIRLLRLLPDHDRIVVGLVSFPLSDNIPAFEALSYAWGTEAVTEHIYCITDPADQSKSTETPFAVSPHLYEGLRCLRATAIGGRPHWIWIDAICINQQDAKEKAIQVPMMSDIYSKAQRVVLWPGKADANSGDAMSRIPELAAKMSEIEDLLGVTHKSASSFGLLDGSNVFWRDLASWYDREWFGRLWVLQEASLAKDLRFQCGTATASYEDASQLAELLRKTQIVPGSKKTGEEVSGLQFLDSLVDVKRQLSQEYDISLLLFLNMTRLLSCREIVDHIYGILGVLHERIRSQIPVDYSAENRENSAKLFTHVAKLMLEDVGPVSRFAIFWFMSRRRLPGSPSWLPGYMYPPDGQALFMERAGLPKDPASAYYDARIASSFSTQPVPRLLHPDNIQISGMVVDEVVDVVHLHWEWSYYSSSEEDEVSVHVENTSRFLYLEQACSRLARSSQHPALSVIYCTTFVANRDIQVLGPYSTNEISDDYHETLAYFQTAQSGINEQGLRPKRPRLYRYVSSISEKWRSGRSFFTTKNGRIGIGGMNDALRKGDRISIFSGAHQLFVLRDTATSGLFTMEGDAYVAGLMDCEAFALMDPDVHGRTFEIC